MNLISSRKRCNWNQVVGDPLLLDDAQVLLDQSGTEAGEEANLVQGGPIPGHIVDPFKVPQVTVYIMGVVAGQTFRSHW